MTVNLRLKDRHTVLFGKRGEGKSNLVQWILKNYPNAIVYDMCREHDVEGVTRYVPENRSGEMARAEAGEFTKRIITENDRERRPDLVIYEEASRYLPNGGGTHDAIFDLADQGRHYGVGTVAVARRPAKIDTSIREMADTALSFYVSGKNDVNALNAIEEPAGDLAKALPEYHFVKIEGREIDVCQPVPEQDTTGEL